MVAFGLSLYALDLDIAARAIQPASSRKARIGVEYQLGGAKLNCSSFEFGKQRAAESAALHLWPQPQMLHLEASVAERPDAATADGRVIQLHDQEHSVRRREVRVRREGRHVPFGVREGALTVREVLGEQGVRRGIRNVSFDKCVHRSSVEPAASVGGRTRLGRFAP